MPHCIIEYSEDISPRVNQLMATVHSGALKTALFNEDDIKTRAISYKNFQTGQSNQSFIHTSIKILSGRTQEQKLALSQSVLSELKQLKIDTCCITVEILDIDKDSYSKIYT